MSILVSWNQPIHALSFLYPRLLAASIPQTTRRHASSARRNQKRLRVHPDATSLSPKSPVTREDPIIHNPPSSAPNPYHTPPAFLPRSDPRRALHAPSFTHYNPYSDPSNPLPPLARKSPGPKKYHLKPEEFEEIRRLRKEDPYKWTRKKLAETFGCSQLFVGMLAETTKAKKEFEKEKIEKVKDRWGSKRRFAREERVKRSALVEMDR